MTDDVLVRRLDTMLAADPRRVIAKLFVPGENDALVRSRATALIARIAALGATETCQLLGETVRRFGDRHRDIEAVFAHHYDLIHHRVAQDHDLSATARLLVGAYFTHEYAVEAAALCNPSVVAHPDQTGLDAGELRVVVSLRLVGEGHLSSIGFLTGVVGPEDSLRLEERTGSLAPGRRTTASHRRELLAAGLMDEDSDNEVAATVLGLLPERFTDEDFERALAHVPPELLTRITTHSALEQLRRLSADSYALSFPADVPLDRRIIWPTAPAESNGMEDARFVRWVADDGRPTYRATYTAYDGRHIGGRRIATDDFVHFDVAPLRGPAARNKGMALFPRKVGGRSLALCRSDGETLGLTELDAEHRWHAAAPLHVPRHAWELIQVGNCGSPIETDKGWLVLTHGVGPMRRYTMGALLLDLEHPEQVVAELPGVLLEPDAQEREGYVPNVVYSCGGLLHDGTVWLPYGASDARVGFATVNLDGLLAAMVPR